MTVAAMDGFSAILAASCMQQLLSRVWCAVASSSQTPVLKLLCKRASMQRLPKPVLQVENLVLAF